MTSQQRCGRSQCSTARPATRFHQTMWPRDHVCLPNVTFNPTGSPPAGKFRSSHRRVRGRRGRPSVVLQLWVTLKLSRLFAFKGGAHALCSTRLKILPCFLSQTFATTRKFVRSTAPRRWSSPTPPTSTSAGTRCPTLLVGCEPAQTPPRFPTPSAGLARGLLSLWKQHVWTLTFDWPLFYVCVCACFMNAEGNWKESKHAHTKTRGVGWHVRNESSQLLSCKGQFLHLSLTFFFLILPLIFSWLNLLRQCNISRCIFSKQLFVMSQGVLIPTPTACCCLLPWFFVITNIKKV